MGLSSQSTRTGGNSTDFLLSPPPRGPLTPTATCKLKQVFTHPPSHNRAPHAYVKMPRYSIYPESLMAPNKFSPFLSVSFRRGVESRDPIVSPMP